MWDAVDHSCGFDAFLSVLWNLTSDRGLPWLSALSPDNDLLQSVSAAFLLAHHAPEYLEIGRDALRDKLVVIDPNAFPRRGTTGIVLTELVRVLLRRPHGFGSAMTHCGTCSNLVRHVPDLISTGLWPIDPFWWRTVFPQSPSVSAQEFVTASLDTPLSVPCSACGTQCAVSHELTSVPPLLVMESLPGTTITPCETVTAVVSGVSVCWRLVGVIYFGWRHYTSRFMDQQGLFWYHDGVTTARYCIRESTSYNGAWLSNARSRTHSHLVYEHID
ncbi:hypothetical protein OH76DRAFT_1359470 [Lentinus brumalis]|uniref:USP domain-containing protein n=1 Tax=Lentinus brumalis TaxID=2498619 RepID=A0A371CWB0_9APHY|nr:hypothetical protein OH76DRAFT_1359470 [Polyporus brumalis]